MVGGNYKKICGFKPGGANYQKAKEILKYDNMELLPCGLWDENINLHFDSKGNGQSKMNDESGANAKVVRLDDAIDEKVTFIKMDIEGAELNAINGAQETIIRNRPKFAICLYHRPEDLYEIPLRINELVPEYKLFIKHHGGNVLDSVLYAVP